MSVRNPRFGLAFVVAIAITTTGQTAPALGDRPTKWEYAELTWQYTRLLPPKGQAGGVGADSVTVKWITADQTIEAKGWDEIGDKIKVPTIKDEAPAAQRKMRMLNRLGSDGWEMVDHRSTSNNINNDYGIDHWTFKRRVP
jgi:hypothetical protein